MRCALCSTTEYHTQLIILSILSRDGSVSPAHSAGAVAMRGATCNRDLEATKFQVRQSKDKFQGR